MDARLKSLFQSSLGSLNALAVPFLDDQDAEDDYVLLPPPKPNRRLPARLRPRRSGFAPRN